MLQLIFNLKKLFQLPLLNAFKWSYLSEIFTRAVQPAGYLALTFYLNPEDFGIVSSAMMIIAFSQIFWEAGFGKAIIQWKGDLENVSSTTFWINLLIGLLFVVGLNLLSDILAKNLFNESRVEPVLRMMSVAIFTGSLGSIHSALLQKSLNFKALFKIKVVTILIPVIVSLPLASMGFGYWSMVVGLLIAQVIQVFMLWNYSQFRPKFYVGLTDLRLIGKFSLWVMFTGLLSWFYLWFDSFLIVRYYGIEILGTYRVAITLVTSIFALFLSPSLAVIYAKLVKLNKNVLNESFQNLSQTFSFVSFLITSSVILALLTFGGILNDKWEGIHFIIVLVSLYYGVAHIFSPNGEFYRASGRPKLETWPLLLGLFIFLPVYLIVVREVIETFVMARLFLVMFIGSTIHISIMKKYYDVELRTLIKGQIIFLFLSLLVICHLMFRLNFIIYITLNIILIIMHFILSQKSLKESIKFFKAG